jgi:hypothetical protein
MIPFALGVIASSIRKIGAVTPQAPAAAGFAMDAYTSVLMHMDNGQFTDEAGHVFTNNGNVTCIADPEALGGYAAHFDGESYLSTPRTDDLTMGTDSFTIEFYLSSNNAPGYYIYLIFAYVSGANDFLTYIDNNGALTFYGGGSVSVYGINFIDGKRRHIAFVYDKMAGQMSIYVDGIKKAYGALNPNFTSQFDHFTIGGSDPSITTRNRLNGTIDELRVSKGIARYGEDFTPPV